MSSKFFSFLFDYISLIQRIRTRVSRCVIEFIDNCDKERLSPYANELVRIILNVIKEEDPNTLVVHNSVTALASIGTMLGKDMGKVRIISSIHNSIMRR